MLTVLGIRDGIVGTLTRKLLENPRNRELSPMGDQSLPGEFVETLRTHPDAEFIIAETRAISATVNLAVKGRPSLDADLTATALGDPIISLASLSFPDDWPTDLGAVFVSESAAERLSLAPGDVLAGRVGRTRSGREEVVSLPLTVLGVIPRHIVGTNRVFCSSELMAMIEDYRSRYAVPELGWEGEENPFETKVYSRFRLYSRDLDGVERLRVHLQTLGVETVTQASQIALVKDLDRAFTVVFLALFVVVGGGAFASAASGSTDQVVKMRRSLAVLALLGLSKGKLLFFVMLQTALTGFLASVLAEALFLLLSAVLNYYFSGTFMGSQQVCALAPHKLAAAGLLTVIFMTLASGCAYHSLADIEPSEGMREV
ncbi:MAG: hypothetical protein LBJ64_09955 [Deltaproteobacteria bacterium]|nr:hypothetical protein [Deltaproteobacteria bacterium]